MQPEKTELTVERCKDSGLALVLISLICFMAWKQQIFVWLAIGFLLMAMTWPPVFKPFARFWFGLSTFLGTIVSKIILTLAFYLLVFPVGLVRRALGKDPMLMGCWKNGNGSVFRVREHRFAARDLEHPY